MRTRFSRRLIRNNISGGYLDTVETMATKEIEIKKLSGGERRRTEIARALALKPQFLLLDEPFAGIDPIAVSELKITLNELKKMNIGILISDHNVRETMQICNRVSILSDGKMVAEGSADEISNNKLVREIYLGKDF